MPRILLLAPDRSRASSVRGLLRADGHQVLHTRSVEEWRAEERERLPDIVVASVEDTDTVLRSAGGVGRGFAAPLLFVQHETDFCRDLFLDDRLVDRIISPFLGEELLGRVDGLVRVRNVITRDRTLSPERPPVDGGAAPRKRLKGLGGRFAALLGSRVPRYQKPLAPYLEVAARLAKWADRRDAFEPGHAERVTGICAMIAEALGMSVEETSALLRAAMLHDIGKVALPVEVLQQRAPLEERQMRLIRTHPRRGAALLRALDTDEDVAATILYHHERPDGRGYYGLDAASTPPAARILAVAEIYDAMTSSRLGRRISSARALGELDECKGETVDADCVEALVDKLKPSPATIPLARQP